MTSRFTDLIIVLLITVFLSASVSAQQIWPGDVDDKGKVTVTDLLYLGHAFGAEGPARQQEGAPTTWNSMTMGAPWAAVFPDTTNFAYADANGDGKIQEEDLKLVKDFFGRQHNTNDRGLLHSPDTTAGIPMLGVVPINLRPVANGILATFEVQLSRDLGGMVQHFYGLAFELDVPANVLSSLEVGVTTDTTSWAMSPGEIFYGLGRSDTVANRLTIGLTRINHQNISGSGKLATFKLLLKSGISLEQLRGLSLSIRSLVMVNRDLQSLPIGARASTVITYTNCPLTVSPVCGANGVTYLNGCFAEAAGITFYTAGACWDPGISLASMDSLSACPQNYNPVCGFNYVTYANACTAENAGVVSFSSGQCGPNDFECYDPNQISISSSTSVNTITGVIQMNCPLTNVRVLGCNGITYPNACIAEASGVRSYTTLGGGNDCVDYTQIDQNANCNDEIDFVCGCNGYTFVNACYAEAAGIQSYTSGPCGGTSNICAEAIPISCGAYLPNETTIGAGNQMTNYPGGTSAAMLGPDRVYVIQKTGAGDLQVGLEIMTPGLDMDIFVLRGDCNNLVCVGASTTSNTITNNEGIVINDAPIGTYYIIVDQQQPGQGGNYRLEVSCGHLDCSDAVALSCGVTYSGSNIAGNDDVSLYACGNTLNVENNGPEIVHTFTTNAAGVVTINLTGLSANLELFLLSDCDRGACLQFSQNPGTANEQIVRNLQPGTYYVVVDGYNGAISNYNLTVDCSQSCQMTYQGTGTTNAGCGQNNGVHNFSVYNGSPTYIATYSGPVSGSAVSQTGHFCFVNLPTGNYTLTVRDAGGCFITRTFVIGDGGSMNLTLAPVAASCGSEGRISATVTGSNPPYTIAITGQETATLTSPSNTFTINNLSAGFYTIFVTNANGCVTSSSATVQQGAGNLNVITTPYSAGCGQEGRIHIAVQNGFPSYTVRLQGPRSGSAIVNANSFNLINLPAGAYWLTLTDAFGCVYQADILVPDSQMDVQVSTTPASCANPGSALVSMSNGTAPFTVNYFGPTSGTVTTNNNSIVINGLASGSYNFSVWDASGCDQLETAFVGNQGGNLSVSIVAGSGSCGANTSPVFFNVTGGTPAYTVAYTGPQNGTFTINGSGQGMINLPNGNYTFITTDFNGCSYAESITLNGVQNNLAFTAQITANSCGEMENITTSITGGSAPYSVTVTNACGLGDTTFQTFNTQFTLRNRTNCTYQILVTAANGCSTSRTITVNNTGNLDLLSLTPVGGACQGIGYIDLAVNGGDDPYYITWTGPVSGFVNLISPTYRVLNLPAGVYTFNITTTDGCTDTESVTLNNGGNLELVSSLVTMDCGQYDQIWNDIFGGTPPYTVEVVRLCDGDSSSLTTTIPGFELFDLIPCDYKIKVTDANGCMVMNTVRVFPYELFDLIPTPGLCGQNGTINVNILNTEAMAPFNVSYVGPQSSNFSTGSRAITLSNLPAGTYTFTITDAGGCTETETVVLQDNPSDLDLLTAIIFNECGQYNQLWNDINGGVPPFTVVVTRLCDNTIDTTFITSGIEFELFDLDECTYKITVTDANGCMDMETRTVTPSDPELFTPTPVSGPCGALGRIDVSFTGGTAPYQFSYTGPQSGNTVVNGTSISLNDLPAGAYTIMVTDQNGCSETQTVTVEVVDGDLELISSIILNDCGQYNQIWSDINGGTPPYNVTVTRLCDSTMYANFISPTNAFELFDLPPCTYKIVIVDAAGCMTMETVTVFPSPTNLFDLTPFNGACNELGGFDLNFVAGTPPYTIQYTGPVGDTITVDSMPLTISNLPSGTYTVIVRDSLDCVETMQTTIINTTTDLELVTAIIFNECGQYNQLWNDINGGVAPFTVEVTRLCDNTIDTTFTTSDVFFELYSLTPCTYKVKVTDATGCMSMTTRTINSTSADLVDYTLNTDCSAPSIVVNFTAGTAPYTVSLMGPGIERVFNNVTGPAFTINNVANADYMIIVVSAENCTEFDFFNFTSTGQGEEVNAQFEFAQAGTTVVFTNLSSVGDYSWAFGDGNTSTQSSPTHNFGMPGTYQTCLTVSTGCGMDQLCREITVSTGSIAGLDIGEATGAQGTVVSVPVTISGVDNLGTLAGSLRLSPVGRATIVGIEPVLINPQFNATNLTFSYFSESNLGVSLTSAGPTVLFNLRVLLNASEGTTDLFFADAPIPLEFTTMVNGIPQQMNIGRTPGRVSVQLDNTVDIGIYTNDYRGNPVGGITYNLASTDGTLLSYPAETDGSLEMNDMPMGETYALSAEKEGSVSNGLSTFGLYIGQRYLLGLEAPQITSPYQIIAADVNCSNSFSTVDLYLIQRLILGDLESFAGCPGWMFVHESSVMPQDWNAYNVFPAIEEVTLTFNQDMTTSFVAVKKGDILGMANPANLDESAEGRETKLLTLSGELPQATAGQAFSLQLSAEDLAGLASLQFQLDFDRTRLAYVGSEMGTALASAVLSETRAERGQLRMSWYNPQGAGSQINEGEVLTLHFQALTDIDNWNEVISLNDTDFLAEGFRANHERLRPVLNLSTETINEVTSNETTAFRVYQNRPNPFNERTAINFDLPRASEVSLTIMDALGRQVLNRKQAYHSGTHTINLDLQHLAAGLYYYHLQAEDEVKTLPMMIQR